MELKLEILGVLSVLELLIWFKPFWRWRKPVAVVLIIALSVVAGQIFGKEFSFWTFMIFVLTLYRLVNLLRLVEGRMQKDFLYHVTRRTSIWLILLQALVLGALAISDHSKVYLINWLYILSGGQLIVITALLISTIRNIKAATPPVNVDAISDRDMPTLTVAIPARNETEDLENCLQALIACKYPKLEILVLDDCSQNKRTPEIIRSFAQAGVRFIAGQEPPDYWLAKNFAYKQLADEANGELILFCGVDARFSPSSLNSIVETFISQKNTMMSIVPRNLWPEKEHLAPLLIQPNRYAWEFALPRKLFKRPPVLSTCWLISAAMLKDAGGFDAVSHKIIPESYFARQANNPNNSHENYAFRLAQNNLEVSSQKSFSEQRATAIRTRYPQLHKRIELATLIGLAEFFIFVWPLLLSIYALVSDNMPLLVMAALGWLAASVVQSKIINITYRRFVINGLWILPMSTLYDIALLNYSMWQYEFGEVNWKGRNICVPIMNFNPRPLPGSEQKS